MKAWREEMDFKCTKIKQMRDMINKVE